MIELEEPDPAVQLVVMDVIRLLYFVRESALWDAVDTLDALVVGWESLHDHETNLRMLARQALDILQCLQRAFSATKLALDDVLNPLCSSLRLALKTSPLVHVLIHGRTPCWLAAPPVMWPEGETWVSVDDLPTVDPEIICEWCIRRRVI